MLSKLTELFRRDADETNEDAWIDSPVAAAALMLEVTWADHTIDDKEIATSTELLQQLFKLPATTARQLVDDALSAWRQHGRAALHSFFERKLKRT